jgi:hypothetical protein
MAFNRLIELKVTNQANIVTDMADLEIEWSIERSISFSENSAEFTIFNAKEDTRKKVLKEGNNIVFSYGYEDENVGSNKELGNIYSGNIKTAASGQTGTDWITTIQATTQMGKNKKIENVYVRLSYGPGTSVISPLKEIANRLELVLIGESNANIKMPNGYTFVGAARSGLKYIKEILRANNAEMYTDNNEIVIYKKSPRTSRFTPVFLDYESGLLNINDITDYDNKDKNNPKRVSIESIIIPKFQPNGIVTIANTGKLEGTYFIEKMTIEGNNFGGDNRIIMEATA